MTNEEAIEILDKFAHRSHSEVVEYPRKVAEEAFNMAIEALKEQKKGVWVAIDHEPHETWECDLCGFVIDGSGCIDPDEYRDIYKYCPNCGASMEGESE